MTMTRTERLLRLARQRGDRAAELILSGNGPGLPRSARVRLPDTRLSNRSWTEAELRAAWGDR